MRCRTASGPWERKDTSDKREEIDVPEHSYTYGRNSPINRRASAAAGQATTAATYALAAGAGAVALSRPAMAAVTPWGQGAMFSGFGPMSAAALGRLIPVLGAATLAYGLYRTMRFAPVLGAPSSAQLAATGWTIARFCEEGNTRGDSSEGPVCGDTYNFSERRNNGSIIRTWFKTGVTVSGPIGRFGYRAERTVADVYAPRSRGPAVIPYPAGIAVPNHPDYHNGYRPGSRPIPAAVSPLVDAYAPPNTGVDPPMPVPFAAVPRIPRATTHGFPQGPDRGYNPIPVIPPVIGVDVEIGGGGGVRPVVRPQAPAVAREVPPPNIKEAKAPNSRATLAAIAAFQALSWASEVSDFVDVFHKNLPKKYRKGKSQAEKMRDLWNHWDKLRWKKALWDALENQLQDAAIGSLYGAGRLAANAMDPTGNLWRTYQTHQSTRIQQSRIERYRTEPSYRGG